VSPSPVTTSEQIATQFLPNAQRNGSALCLSGGGYRAALFHLGAARRLAEVGILQKITDISSVSGGSIFAAHLALYIAAKGWSTLAQDYESQIARPFRAFVKNDIRTTPALRRLLPWEWSNANAGADALQKKYAELLVGQKTLQDLPDEPRFTFCATDLAFGVSWIFSKDAVGHYQAGYLPQPDRMATPIAQAVACSSCFPPVFRPLALGLDPAKLTGGMTPGGPERDELVRQITLSDGGVYDNMGLEPVWKRCASIIVSDGGKPFTFAKESSTPQQLYRIHDVMANQAEAVRKRWLVSSFIKGVFGGAYFGIQNSVTDFPVSNALGYSKPLATQLLARIRTDMDAFSDDEIAVLENHGYTLAEAAYQAHLKAADQQASPLAPLSNPWWPGAPSAQNELEKQLASALSTSSEIHMFGHQS
jgi:NTE family protein